MITFSVIKLFLSNAIGFIAKNWRVILIWLIVSVAFYYKTAYERKAQELTTFKAEIVELTAKTKAENEKKLIIATNKVAAATAQAKAEMQRLQLDRARETKNLKALYENSQFILNRTKSNYDERLRIETNRAGVSEVSASSEIASESERNSYISAYRTLEQSCAITTLDYSALWNSWSESCKVLGCE